MWLICNISLIDLIAINYMHLNKNMYKSIFFGAKLQTINVVDSLPKDRNPKTFGSSPADLRRTT